MGEFSGEFAGEFAERNTGAGHTGADNTGADHTAPEHAAPEHAAPESAGTHARNLAVERPGVGDHGAMRTAGARELWLRTLKLCLGECELVYMTGRGQREIDLLAEIFLQDLEIFLRRARPGALREAFSAHRLNSAAFPNVRDIRDRLPAPRAQAEPEAGARTPGIAKVFFMARRGDAAALGKVREMFADNARKGDF